MTESERLKHAIDALEKQREILGDDVTNSGISALSEKLAVLNSRNIRNQERKQVTVLFADLAGFTGLSESLDPEEIREIMDCYINLVTLPVITFNGDIEKYIGDAVMAVFGRSVSRESDPGNAVKAAIEMQEAVKKFNNRLVSEHGFSLSMRIGINTGPVVTGFVGNAENRVFTIIGDTVNTASRLENNAPDGGILISYDTFIHTQRLFNSLQLDPVNVKGKKAPVPVYLVKGLKRNSFSEIFPVFKGADTKMTGRQDEFDLLKNTFNNSVIDKKRQMITVFGDAGIGKSRLRFEFESWIKQQQLDPSCFRASGREAVKNQPYALIRDMFTNKTGMSVLEKESDILRGFDKVLLDGKENAVSFLSKYFKSLSEKEPVVIILEDLQWADGSSLKLINYIAHALKDCSLMILSFARTGFFKTHSGWAKHQKYQSQIELVPFSSEESVLLIKQILHRIPVIPDVLYEMIISHSEGNPFYIEEFIRMLIEEKVIINADTLGEINFDNFGKIHLPSTLRSLLQSRIDLLEPGESFIIKQASISGKRFWDEMLIYINTKLDTALDKKEIRKALYGLQEKGIISLSGSSEFINNREYKILNTNLLEAAKQSLLLSVRRNIHLYIAEWIILNSEDTGNNCSGIIAEHFKAAGKNNEAVHFFCLAAEKAAAQNAVNEASAFYTNALSLLNNDENEKKDLLTKIRNNLLNPDLDSG